ncbi:MAG TPA: PRC-barrel domain-containing protein [Trueperaceae bacterium]
MATNMPNRNLSATTLIGDPVMNPDGEKLGTLKDIMLDFEAGRIAYGVLDFGGFMNMGDKLFAIPAEAFDIDYENHSLILNVDKDTLKNAEGFDKNNWPDTANREWGNRIHEHYGYTPYWER